MAKISMNMIRMYCELLDQRMYVIHKTITSRKENLQKKVEINLRKEFGLTDLYKKEANLEGQLSDVRRKIKEGTPKGYPLHHLASDKISKTFEEITKAVYDVEQELRFEIKLAGVSDDIKTVFEKLPKLIAKFNAMIETMEVK